MTFQFDALFVQWWAAYPNKTGKLAAYKVWRKLHPDAATTKDMLATLAWQKQSDQWQRGYIPHPTTYLNQGRWMDEPPQAQPQGDQEWASLVQRVGKARGVM